MKKLLLFLLFSTAAFAQIDISPLPDFAICDSDNDGFATFDLTANTPIVLGTLLPADYTVTYYETQNSAQNNTFIIDNPATYTNIDAFTNQTLYVRVTDNANPTNYAVTTLTIIVLRVPVITSLPSLSPSACTGQGIFNLTLNTNLIDPQYNVTFYATDGDANTGQNPITAPTIYETDQLTIWVRIENVPTDLNTPVCFIVVPQALNRNIQFNAQVTIADQTVTVITTGVAPFQYAADNNPYQESNIFTNLTIGFHTIRIQDACGNVINLSIVVTAPNPPTGATTQTFTEGQTLADLEVFSRATIQWYDAPTQGNELPLTNVLEDGTTYYAERTVNGNASANRLGVTVRLVLGTGSNTLQTLTYYPNPVKNVLNVKNATLINSIAAYNTLGQQVVNNTINATETTLDLSALNSGVYFVRIQAAESSKTIRIVKD